MSPTAATNLTFMTLSKQLMLVSHCTIKIDRVQIGIVSGYTKIFRHDIKGGFFTDYAEAGNKNAEDENADLFSVLDTLDFFRGLDGKFLFKLCYPEVEGSTGGHCNEWYQTSDPFTDSVITGFDPVKIEFPGKTNVFAGLGSNSEDPDNTDKITAVSIPPAEEFEQNQAVTVVELFVSKARINPHVGVGLGGALTVRCTQPGEDLDIGYNLKELQLTCTKE